MTNPRGPSRVGIEGWCKRKSRKKGGKGRVTDPGKPSKRVQGMGKQKVESDMACARRGVAKTSGRVPRGALNREAGGMEE